MSTAEFRAWVRTLDPIERRLWRHFRRQLSQTRYEKSEKRQWIVADPPFPPIPLHALLNVRFNAPYEDGALPPEEEERMLEPVLALEGEALKAFVDALPEELRDEFRRVRRKELAKRWRRENAERHRAASKDAYERMKADPERWEAYKAKKREQMQERRKRGDG